MNNRDPQYDFSIRRHAVQRLLRFALDAAPEPICGLLGGHQHNVEYVLPLHDQCEAQDGLKHWQQQGIVLLATYASSSEAAAQLSALMVDVSDIAGVLQLPLLHIRTDMKGRIEAELQAANNADDSTVIWPLQMQEDGGLYPLAYNS
ncbi:MAG: hypothetical protein R8K53_00330 [Mariprofundaceae bacterium]